MRSRLIGILVIGCVLVGIASGRQLPAQISVRQQFDSEIYNLERNIQFAKSSQAKWTAIEKSERNIASLRTSNAKQFQIDEKYMDQFEVALQQIPRGENFKTENCATYSEILAVSAPEVFPRVENVLNSLCTKN